MSKPDNPRQSPSLDNAFWRYSLAVYGHKPLQAELLQLQASLGANVNELLLNAWLRQQGLALEPRHWQQLTRLIQPWINATCALRELRQPMTDSKPHSAPAARLYQLCLQLELVSEQFQQAAMYSTATEHSPGWQALSQSQGLRLQRLLAQAEQGVDSL
jgi:uncharacterized protein (TIGR02444 family)